MEKSLPHFSKPLLAEILLYISEESEGNFYCSLNMQF